LHRLAALGLARPAAPERRQQVEAAPGGIFEITPVGLPFNFITFAVAIVAIRIVFPLQVLDRTLFRNRAAIPM